MEEEKRTIEINWNTRIRTNPNFVLREICGENILVPISDAGSFENTAFTLNETAAFMWKLFMDGATMAEVRDKVLAQYTSESENNTDILIEIMEYVIQNIALNLLVIEEHTDKVCL